MNNPVIIVMGTRPEAIKLLPVYLCMKKAAMPVYLCATYQHTDLLQQVLDIFHITPDERLDIMQYDQSLASMTSLLIERLSKLFMQQKPKMVIVQGDTATAFCAALCAFYQKTPVAHVEAGLRTGDFSNPFPEEFNRVAIGSLATYHFTATPYNTANLLATGIARDKIFQTGNTVVDALQYMRHIITTTPALIKNKFKTLVHEASLQKRKIILITVHRRESFGQGIQNVFQAIYSFAQAYPEHLIIYSSHPNPHIVSTLQSYNFSELTNVIVTESLSYIDFIYCMMNATLILSDSGGVQEEAVSIGKRILVLRNKTERPEGVWEGFASLVGTDSKDIFIALEAALQQQFCFEGALNSVYGDGAASQKITRILQEAMSEKTVSIVSSNAATI